MRILQLCNRVPFPPHDGGAVAMLNMTKGLHELGQELHLLCLNTLKHYIAHDKLPPLFSELASFKSIGIDTDLKAKDAFWNLFSSKSYNIIRFWSEAYAAELAKILRSTEFDIVHLEGLSMALYIDVIRKHSKAKIVMRAHNIEYLIWQRMVEVEKSGPKKWYLNLLTERLKRFELDTYNKIDAVVPITKVDADFINQLGFDLPAHVSPTGLDLDQYPIDTAAVQRPSVFHLGALDWMPNQQGVKWFINEVWPIILKQFPDLILYIAGRHIPKDIIELDVKGIKVVGEVPDAKAFMNSKEIMIVPLLSGSGMRIKIIEGMAMGKPIVSTSIGAEGIEVSPGESIMLADTPEAFAEKIIELLQSRQKADAMGAKARLFVEQHYANQKLIAKLIDFYKSL